MKKVRTQMYVTEQQAFLLTVIKEKTGTDKTEYIRQALQEKLERDGYIQKAGKK